MNYYIGTKLLKAKELNLGRYLEKISLMKITVNNDFRGWKIPENEDPEKEGYLIEYSDGYISWSPKEIFEKAYLKVDDNPELPSRVSIGADMVKNFIKEKHVQTIGDKTTLVRVVLVNDFEIIESSSCVEASNYSKEVGEEICMSKIIDKIWMLLGFLLQTAYKGVK